MKSRILALCLALSATPAFAQQSGFAEVEGGRLYYETCGTGTKNLVLLHDGVIHSAAWDAVWPALCQRYHVVRYDRRGFGQSKRPVAPYAPTSDLAAVMAAAGMARASLIGSSSGSGIAVDFTLDHPEAVDRLVVVSPSISGFRPSIHFMLRGLSLYAPIILRKDVTGTIQKGARDRYLMGKGREAERAKLKVLLLANPQNISHPDPIIGHPPARPRLGAIKAPTLVMAGEIDIADVRHQAAALEKAIPGAQRVTVKDAGHLMYIENPGEFTDRVTAFLGD